MGSALSTPALSAPALASETPRVIEITARRFAFEPDLVEVAQGETLRLVLRSADVGHGLEIEELGVAVKIPKGGDPVSVEFVAERAGSFRIACSQYCGSGHRSMRGELRVAAPGAGAR